MTRVKDADGGHGNGRPMTRGKRLLALGLAGAALVCGALWARRQTDPNRFRSFSVPSLESWVADHPDDGDALYELGRRYRAAGQLTDARQALERARRLEPGNARLLNDLGELQAARGNLLAAQALFEQAARLRPDLPEPRRGLGDLAGIAGNYALAIQQYRQALALQPDHVATLTSLGSAYADAQNRGEAEAAFRKALALAPHSADTYQRMGLALFKLHDDAGARTALEQALALAPNDAHTHLFLGLADARSLRTPALEQEALAQFDRAVALGYSGGDADYGRGLVYLHQKKYPQAAAALERAVRQDAGAADARYRLARTYLAMGQTAKGQAMLRQFQQLKQTEPALRRLRFQLAEQPGNLAMRRRLARLCVDTGRYQEALQQYRLLMDAGAADAELFQGLARAATALGNTRLANQARASLRQIAAQAVPPRH